MAWNKFDPDAPDDHAPANPQAARRAKLLRYGWWIATLYTALGFVFLALFVLRPDLF